MAQHDYVIANGSGSAVRSDLNNALSAIVSLNSGTSEPTDTFAYMLWADTTAGVLKIRNAANNAWITLRELDGTLTIEGGSASTPGLYFAGDANTGIYSPSADQFAITTGGVERVEWGASGVVFNDGGEDYDFRIEGDTEANLFFVNASNDCLGIKTGNPTAPLTIEENATSYGLGGIKIQTAGSNESFLALGVSSSLGAGYVTSSQDGTGTSLPLYFNTGSGPVTAMCIDSSQRVGIGTVSPSQPLHVEKSTNGTQTLAYLINPNTGGTNETADLVLALRGTHGTAQCVISAGKEADISTAANADVFLAFSTTADDVLAEAMRINSAGELLIGYTADNGAYKLQVNSQIFATSATVATSDGRYKENVATLGGCLDLVKALRPVSFTWKPQEDIICDEKLIREGHNFPNGTQIGFIAQEVQEVLADKPWLGSVIKENTRPAINDDVGNELAPEEQFLGIAEGNLIAVLTNALQEAIAKIETLEAKVAALEAP